MKLEKFKKNKKFNNILLALGIASVILGGGGILVYRSYAFYEEEVNYNVLKGQVGDFTKGDVQLAFLVDGSPSVTMPQKDSGYYFTNAECTNNATASWDAVNWGIEVENITNTKTTCTLSFNKMNFNYGDGSLNTISKSCTLDGYACTELDETVGGYVDKVSIFNTATGKDYKVETTVENLKNWYTGNMHGLGRYRLIGDFATSTNQNLIVNNITTAKYVDSNATPAVLQGGNEFAIVGITGRGGFNTIKIKGDNNSIILIEFDYSNLNNPEISNLQIYLDGQYYTLKEAVEAGKIKPLVLMLNSMDVAGKNKIVNLGNNPVNLFDGGKFIGQYPMLQVYFMLEKNVIIKGVKFESNRNIFSRNGDFAVRKIDNMIMHLSE